MAVALLLMDCMERYMGCVVEGTHAWYKSTCEGRAHGRYVFVCSKNKSLTGTYVPVRRIQST